MTDHVTISTAPTREQTVIGGSTETTSIGFEFFEEDGSDVDVYIDGVITTAYEITPNYGTEGGYEGGTITWDVAQASVTVTTVLQVALSRLSDFPVKGSFNIKSLNTQLDKLWAVNKQQQDEIDRATKLAITDATGAAVALPTPAAGALIGIWDAAGTAIEIGPTAASITSAEANAVLTAADVGLTNADVVLTGLDVTQTGLDLAATAQDVIDCQAILDSMPLQLLIGMALGNEITAVAAANGVVTFHVPLAWTLTAVYAGLTTTQTSGNIITFDINEGGVSILSTKITIDNGETFSLTAATPPVISDTSLAAGAVITVDVDQIGDSTAIGAKIYLVGRPT